GRQNLRINTVWHPQAEGEDGRVSISVGGGVLQGQLPLTERFAVGMERDGAIPLRGHIGTQHGWKGSALYGDRYMVANLEVDKALARLGVVSLKLSAFLAAGWVRDAHGLYDARKVRFDVGIQLVAATAGGTELRVSYAWALRRG